MRTSDDRDRWIRHIKQLRLERNVDLFEAERIALSLPEWRRWVERQINSDPRCRKMALSHLRMHGSAALILLEGETLKVR